MMIQFRAKFLGHRTSGVLVWSIGNGMDTWGAGWNLVAASTRDDFYASNGVRGAFLLAHFFCTDCGNTMSA